MRLKCSECGKTVSTEVPEGTVFRAWATCPECVERSKQPTDMKTDPIFEKLKEAAPSITFSVSREHDEDHRICDQCERDAEEAGFLPYNVDFRARCVAQGELIEQMDSLGGSWYDPEEPIGDAHGYLVQKLHEACKGLQKQLLNLYRPSSGLARQQIAGLVFENNCAMEILEKQLHLNYQAQRKEKNHEQRT